jgi:hypothetical protein
MKAPELAQLVLSQPLPRSPFTSCDIATLYSITEAMTDVIRFNTKEGAKSCVIAKVRVSPEDFTRSRTLSLVQPS